MSMPRDPYLELLITGKPPVESGAPVVDKLKKIPDGTEVNIRLTALKAIEALNLLILAGEQHENVVQADFLINTWFDATFGDEGRE